MSTLPISAEAVQSILTTPFFRILGTSIFAIAVLHTFVAGPIHHLAKKFPADSLRHNLLEYMGEVEAIFGLWATVFLIILSIHSGTPSAVVFLDGLNFAEAAFVFCIMTMAASRPILHLAEALLTGISKGTKTLVPISENALFYVVTLTFGTMLGSFITEPAAMTVCALLLKRRFFDHSQNSKFKYATIGLLFVNISIGGVLTNYAAPPVLMVAGKWNWSTWYMLTHFGIEAAAAVFTSTILTAAIFYSELKSFDHLLHSHKKSTKNLNGTQVPVWLMLSHVSFILLAVLYHAHIPFFLSLFLLFVGWTQVTKAHQDSLKIRESLMVGFFLAGLVTLGSMQGWWLQVVVSRLNDMALFWGSTALTAITDNAALTYLGSLVPDLSDTTKFALVSGAVTGGGLTVIANAPNPAGYGILKSSFGENGISPLRLFLAAFPYTIITAAYFIGFGL